MEPVDSSLGVELWQCLRDFIQKFRYQPSHGRGQYSYLMLVNAYNTDINITHASKTNLKVASLRPVSSSHSLACPGLQNLIVDLASEAALCSSLGSLGHSAGYVLEVPV